MTLRVVFRRAAKDEFGDAAAWYDNRRSGLGEEFAVEIEQAFLELPRRRSAIRSFSATSAALSRDVFRLLFTSAYAQTV